MTRKIEIVPITPDIALEWLTRNTHIRGVNISPPPRRCGLVAARAGDEGIGQTRCGTLGDLLGRHRSAARLARSSKRHTSALRVHGEVWS